MKKFLSTQDIEDLAAQGRAELIIDDDTVLTDLARHAAQQLGIALVSRSRSAPAERPLQAAAPPPIPSPAAPRSETVGLGRKPKGCQHAPLVHAPSTSKNSSPAPGEVGRGSSSPAPGEVGRGSSSPNTVVDQLVSLVKRLGPLGSGD